MKGFRHFGAGWLLLFLFAVIALLTNTHLAEATNELWAAFITGSSVATTPYSSSDYFGLVRSGGTLRVPANNIVTLSDSQTLTNKTIAGASNTLTVRAANDITGTLGLANGGLGITSATSGGVPYGASSSTIAFSAAGTANRPMIWGGAGVAPAAGTVSGNTTLFLTGNGSYTANQGYRTDANGNAIGSSAAVFTDTQYTWTGIQTFATVQGTQNNQSGISYTLAPSDCGKAVYLTNANPITLTLPASMAGLPNNGVGCTIAVEQAGAGQVTLTAASGASFNNAHGFTKTFGQYAIIGLDLDANSGGAAAHWIMTGDGA